MIDANVIARSHFTSKTDGKTSFETFKRAVGLMQDNLPYEYDSQSLTSGLIWHFAIESWGGYTNASGEWTIFMSWRCRTTKVTQYIHWTWNEQDKTVSNRRDYSFVA
jgi:hypothetical protein